MLKLRYDVYGNIPDTSAFFADNGDTFIHLNGKCQIWVYGHLPAHIQTNYGLRRSVRRATLNDDQAIKLLEKLKYLSWKNLDGTSYKGSREGIDGGVQVVIDSKRATFDYSADTVTGRINADERIRDDVMKGIRDAREYLFDLGKPIDQGNMRVYISDSHPPSFWNPSNPTFLFNWPLNFPVKTLLEQQKSYCKGQSFLVKGEDAEVLWDVREAYRIKADQTPTTVLGVKDKKGGKYAIYMRDVLPNENEEGIVDFSGPFKQVASCE